jgi:hypothetical protein
MSRRRRSISSNRYRISRDPVGSDSRSARTFFRNGSSAARLPSVSRSRLLDILLPSTLPAPIFTFRFRPSTSAGGRARSMCLNPPYGSAAAFVMLSGPGTCRSPADSIAHHLRWRACLQFLTFSQRCRYTAAIDSGRACPREKTRQNAKPPIPFNARIAPTGLISSVPLGVRTRPSLRRSAETVGGACVSTPPTKNHITGRMHRLDSGATGFNGCFFSTSE